ncbi:MAG: acyl-CoA dehydratase activase-related protein [Bacilli bacterium]|nr:acyl-CoA dehydratase activase-related protein [Bacilli bacterium]MDD4054125.1 acyl-CoA dehydratase activase-related protein [Bacilli bacterium]MDD4411913.1 acyl-CoA dehydratase activase-related protein [Bacilli bacterium]
MREETMAVGIPKALLYHNYHVLWEHFFNELGVDLAYSKSTDKEILERGKKHSIDEACLSLKIYLGHVDYLMDKVDYILVPRIVSLKKYDKLCTNFYALYDIVNNLFNTKIINYNIDIDNHINEKKAFIRMGKDLGFTRASSVHAYMKAKRIVKRNAKHRFIKQSHLLESPKLKILLAGHPYNLRDKFIGGMVANILKKLDVEIIYSDIYDERESRDKYKSISPRLYWTYNQDIINSILYYQQKVDGIIMITSFPCGPDSLANEMCLRKIDKPIINLIIDELSSEVGLETRIESFIDIIKARLKNG